jgi:hypothetical protein
LTEKCSMKKLIFLFLVIFVCLSAVLLIAIIRDHWQSDYGTSSMSTEQLIQIIEDSESSLFWHATTELAKRGVDAAEAAPALARALSYPRRDSYMAGIALISMGAAAEPAIQYLIPALKNDYSEARAYAAFVLGAIGEESKCAIPEIASLLWDEDPTVRGSAVITLDALTNKNLVPYWNKLNPSRAYTITMDIPEGTITTDARTWWEQEGQFITWVEGSNNCVPPANERAP